MTSYKQLGDNPAYKIPDTHRRQQFLGISEVLQGYLKLVLDDIIIFNDLTFANFEEHIFLDCEFV